MGVPLTVIRDGFVHLTEVQGRDLALNNVVARARAEADTTFFGEAG